MKIALTVGHSILSNGSCTSADGRKYGGCNEYKYNKAFSKQVANALRKNGHKVDVIICPEKKFTKWQDERTYKLNYINSHDYDLVIELHLNAASPNAHGTEVLYKSQKGAKYAKPVEKQLSKVFLSRGIQQRTDLYILNGTNCPAILLETFFCTSKADYKKAKGLINRKKLAKLIANGISSV